MGNTMYDNSYNTEADREMYDAMRELKLITAGEHQLHIALLELFDQMAVEIEVDRVCNEMEPTQKIKKDCSNTKRL